MLCQLGAHAWRPEVAVAQREATRPLRQIERRVQLLPIARGEFDLTDDARPADPRMQAKAVVQTHWTHEERWALVERARGGDKSVRQELRAMLATHPESVRRMVNRPASVTKTLV
jgi:hypothetical protein